MAFNTSEKLVNSCMAATCEKCGKTTWKGCGRHIDAVFANVPKEQHAPRPAIKQLVAILTIFPVSGKTQNVMETSDP
ncbi:hypothetical protein NDA16_000598 [Ustilago loliicola]|nr:hypothetical protein NDA16_000598 [Ustilago loliicola]